VPNMVLLNGTIVEVKTSGVEGYGNTLQGSSIYPGVARDVISAAKSQP